MVSDVADVFAALFGRGCRRWLLLDGRIRVAENKVDQMDAQREVCKLRKQWWVAEL